LYQLGTSFQRVEMIGTSTNALQCVAAWCGVMQFVAVRCSVFVAECCNVLASEQIGGADP